MSARTPLLVDLLLAKPPLSFTPQETTDRVVARLRTARRFVLDQGATLRLAELCRDAPDTIATEQQFVRAPFDCMWVELDFTLLFTTINRDYVPDAAMDGRIGWLVDHGHIYTFSVDRQRNKTALTPFVIDLHEPWGEPECRAFCGGAPRVRARAGGDTSTSAGAATRSHGTTT